MHLQMFFALCSTCQLWKDSTRKEFKISGIPYEDPRHFNFDSDQGNKNIFTYKFQKGTLDCPKGTCVLIVPVDVPTMPGDWQITTKSCQPNAVLNSHKRLNVLFPIPLAPGNSVTVTAKPTSNTRFVISFLDHEDDTLLQVNPRFRYGGWRRKVVIDACIKKKWGEWGDVIGNTFPYKIQHMSNTTVVISNDGFKVYVGTDLISILPHRKVPVAINRLEVRYDVTVRSIKVE